MTQFKSRSDAILAAVSYASEHLLRSLRVEERDLVSVLQTLGQAAEVSRVYVFENHRSADGAELTSQRYEWVADGITPQMGEPDLHDFPWNSGGMGRWYQELGRGELVRGVVKDFPPSEQAILGPQDVLSLAAVPIFVKDRWWGFIGFDDCRTERQWSGLEIEALKTAAGMVGAMIERRDAEQQLTYYHKRLEDRVTERTAELDETNQQLRREISSRKKIEKALANSEQRYRALVEQSLQGIAVVQDTSVVFANQAFADLFEYSLDELMNLRPDQVMGMVDENDREIVFHRLNERLKGYAVPQRYEFRVIRRDGSVRWIEMYANLIEFDGRPAVQAALVDVTRQKRIEEEVARAQKLESVGVLAGGIAHDFNNILTAIIGNLSLARLKIEPDHDAAELLDAAERAAKRSKAFTQQLLTFSRGGAPVRRTMSVAAVVQDAAAFALSGSPTRCEFQVAGDLWPVNADEGQIAQVISNLVINADQAMPTGGVVTVCATNIEVNDGQDLPVEPGRYVGVSVEDHGIGIPSQHVSNVFDPYFTTKKQGMGLGLAVAFSIVKKHDGHMTVESEPGRGTVFHVYLPAAGHEPAAAARSTSARTTAGYRVLVMDDEQSIREFASRALTAHGYDVVTAKNGREAEQLFRNAMEESRAFDAVVLDLTVRGGVGGRDALLTLRELDPGIKAIVSSGYSNDPVMSEPGAYGFQGVVAKPFDDSELVAAIQSLLDNGG